MLSLPSQKYQHGRNALQNVAGFTPQQQLANQMAAKNSGGYSALQQQQLQLQQLASAGMRQMPPLQQMGQRAKGQNTTKSSSHALAQQMRQGRHNIFDQKQRHCFEITLITAIP